MWPALVQAGAQLAGGLIGQSGAQNTNAQQMAFNAQQAQLTRDFQERMSDTQYQRATADMRAAGLNPMLAYQQGGAGTPSGATASTSLQNPGAYTGRGVADAVSSAVSTYQQLQQAKLNENQRATETSRQALLGAQAYDTAMAGSLKANQQAIYGQDDVKQALKDTLLAQLRLTQVNAQEGQARMGLLNAQTMQQIMATRQGRQNDWFTKYAAPIFNDAKSVAQGLLPFGDTAAKGAAAAAMF